MADQFNYYDIDAHYITMIGDGSIVYDPLQRYGSAQVGLLVMLTGEATVGLVTAGKEIFGKLIRVDPDNTCSVMDEGYTDVPTDGTAITYTMDNNGAVGGAVAGKAKVAVAVPAAGAIRTARFIKNDGTNVSIMLIA